MRSYLAAAALLLALIPSGARGAGWEKWSGGDGAVVLVAVDSPDGKNVFAAGMQMDVSTGLPLVNPRVLASSDGGHNFNDISANLAKLPLTTLSAIGFVDANRGFVGVGHKVWSTNDAGKSWGGPVDPKLSVEALHFFDAKHGVAVGADNSGSAKAAVSFTSDGGKTWTPSTGVPDVAGTAHSSLWLDDKVGWVAGWSERTEGTDDQQYDTPDQGFVLATTDGGASWTVSAPIADYGPGPVYFLRDGRTGFATAYQMTDATHSSPALFKSTDSGKTWVDLKVPLDVGKIDMMGFKGPLNASYFLTLFFASETAGHLGGTVYVADSSDGSGQTVHIYRVVDFNTHDGTTWDRTDLGTISMSTTMQNDGTLAAGLLLGLGQGWMVGEQSLVYGYNADPPVPCKNDSECYPGFYCSVFGSCLTMSCPDGCPDGQVCLMAQCRPAGADAGSPAADGSLAKPDVGLPVLRDDAGHVVVDDAGHPLTVDTGTIAQQGDSGMTAGVDASGTTPSDKGCGCAAGSGATGWTLLLLAAGAWASQRSLGNLRRQGRT
jgi:hypothetical protein